MKIQKLGWPEYARWNAKSIVLQCEDCNGSYGLYDTQDLILYHGYAI